MAELIIDIETIPAQRDDLVKMIHDKVSPPKTLKKSESIAKWYSSGDYADACDDAFMSTALNGAYGEICAIGWMWNDGESPQSIVRTYSSEMSERELLENFFSVVRKQSFDSGRRGYIDWIGHNITGFDLPFIMHRTIVTMAQVGTLYIPRNLRPVGNKGVFDTMTGWSGWGKRISLDNLCAIFGVDGKNMKATEVYDCYLGDQESLIAGYVENDVAITAAVYNRMAPYLVR